MWVATTIWYLTLQTGWMASRMRIGMVAAFGHAAGSYAVALVMLGVLGSLFV